MICTSDSQESSPAPQFMTTGKTIVLTLWTFVGNVMSLLFLFFITLFRFAMGFPGGSVGIESACNAETLVQLLGQEDPLEKAMATHFSILAWEIPWTEEPGGLSGLGLS